MATWSQLKSSTYSALPNAWQSVQLFTDTAPTAAGDGFPLDGMSALTLRLIAPSNQTFTGAGSLLAYDWMDVDGIWMPANDYDILDLSRLTSKANGSFPSFQIARGSGRFAFVASGVGASGGSNFTLNVYLTSRTTGRVY